ncbi:MAG: hypothetical protein ACTIM4_14785, partial [Marinomonas sp.]
MKANFISFFLVALIIFLSGCSENDPQPVTLTLKDVRFEFAKGRHKSRGVITEYVADYKNIIIPDNFNGMPVTTIGPEAFKGHGLTRVIIPNSVTEIQRDAFAINPEFKSEVRHFSLQATKHI